MRAEAKKAAAILEAEAIRESTIKKAEGEAEAIMKVREATAQSLYRLKQAEADEAVIRIRSLEALEKMADGQATKIIIPSELQGLAGTLAGLSEIVEKK